jgi:cytochrome c-type biogenesis protein CcmH/NrfF
MIWQWGRGVWLLLAVLLTFGADVGPVRAQGGEEELPPGVTWDDVNAVAHKMYCDVCEGTPLDECESATCREWRDEIARLLGEEYTEDEIIDFFVERYGADVAALPRDKTDRLLVFAVPMAIVMALGVIGAIQVRRLRQRGHQAGQPVRRSVPPAQVRPVPDDVDPAYLERLERELEGFEL